MIRAAFLLLVVLVVAATRAAGQVVETPVPFDSGRKVMALTPVTVARLAIQPPTWPAGGDFVEARLYSVSSGGTVLSVVRLNGQVTRYALTEEELNALRTAINSAMTSETRIIAGARPTEAAVQARGAFARNQMILSAIVYGPLIASFADEGKTATALYLASAGASFFLVSELAKNTYVTRVQNDLATDGTLRGFAGASGLLYAFTDAHIDRKAYSAVALAGAVGGAKLGFEFGKRLTDAEAQSARKASTLSAATAAGIFGATGMLTDPEEDRPIVGAMVAAGTAGYFLGPTYPRRVPYTVTPGDVRLLPLGALLGAAVGVTPFVGLDSNRQVIWAGATAGILGGILVAERIWVRKYDHSHGDATITWLGMTAGALVAGAAALLGDMKEPVAFSATLTGGAILGALAAHGATGAAPGTLRGTAGEARTPGRRPGGVEVQFDASGLALAAARMPGRHALLSVRF